tara:strand:- start:7 stop:615 length:609 start_codon:yes stop_codon:yes gene_type:complete
MACSIDERKTEGVDLAVKAFLGNSTSFKEIKPGVIEMKVSPKFTKAALYNIANKNTARVEKQMGVKYGPKFQNGWTSIDNTLHNSMLVRIQPPNILMQAWNVKMGIKTLAEVNAELTNPSQFSRNLEYFKGDEALMNQEYVSNDEFFSELSETFSNFTSESIAEIKAEYNETLDWAHDTSKDLNMRITDSELARIKRKRNNC